MTPAQLKELREAAEREAERDDIMSVAPWAILALLDRLEQFQFVIDMARARIAEDRRALFESHRIPGTNRVDVDGEIALHAYDTVLWGMDALSSSDAGEGR